MKKSASGSLEVEEKGMLGMSSSLQMLLLHSGQHNLHNEGRNMSIHIGHLLTPVSENGKQICAAAVQTTVLVSMFHSVSALSLSAA